MRWVELLTLPNLAALFKCSSFPERDVVVPRWNTSVPSSTTVSAFRLIDLCAFSLGEQ